MPSVTRSVELSGSPEEAFALATDTARFGEWLTLHDSWPQGEPGAPEQGQQFTQKLKIMGMPADVSWTVEELDSPSKLVMRGAGPMGATLATTISVEPNGGSSVVSYEAEFAGGGIQGPMGEMVTKKAGEEIEVHNPSEMPRDLLEVEEPYIRASIILPKEYVGTVMELNQERRGDFHHLEYLSEERVLVVYDLPLAEVVFDYYDQLKSRTRGYASFDYDLLGFRPGELVKLDILLAGDEVDALSLIVHREKAYARGKALVDRLRQEIPRQLFDVPVQAAIGSRVIARETIKARRKDVLAKCYGGDISRKRKLIEKQKEGKKRMRQLGSVEVPQEAFLAVLNLDGERRE